LRPIQIGRSINPRAGCLAELGEKIDRCAVSIEPTRILPARTHQDVGAGIKNCRHAIRLQIGSIGDADFPRHNRNPVQRLASLLVSQLEEAEAFARQIKGAMDAPQPVSLLGEPSRLRHRRGINDADQSPPARRRRPGRQRMADQHGKPIPALAQAIEQRHVGDIDKPDRGGPGSGRPQTPFAKAIGQDHAKQIDRVCHLSRAQKGFRFPCARLDRRRSAKPPNDGPPIPSYKRFVSHRMLESHMIPQRNPYSSAYAINSGAGFRREMLS